MGERGLSIRSGVNKLGWEETDFPIICNTCLGDNPYIRMLKTQFARSCRICDRPYSVFKWRPSRDQKPKMVEICQTCGKLKNACQSCLRDLEFNMSMTERDQFLGDQKIEIPTFEANRDYWAEQANKNLQHLILPYNEQSETLKEVLKEPRIVPALETSLIDQGISVPKEQFQPKGILAPDDPKICTLYVSHMTLDITEGDIRDVFSRYGKVESVKVSSHGQTCFVNFSNRKGAEDALNSLYNNLAVKDIELKVQWARQPNKNFSVGKLLTQMKPSNEQIGNFKPVPPKMPPQNLNKSEVQEKEYLLELMKNQKDAIYPSQDPYMNGGFKKQL